MFSRPSVRGLAGLTALLVVALSDGRPVRAADPSEDTLRTLYRIALSAEMCGFPIAARQADALGVAMNRAIADMGLDDDAVEGLYQRIDREFEAEGWDKICAENGTWARGYRSLLAATTR
ncbi:hypothetical protein EYW49_07300 [Siculibacillus lacustris]|uniref:Uncharacterized protein n=1 Tax=Siculibacillus lacustris TaxID=1549641 RepID=A0A4Q9VT83_9HYPH|nr:hypothetical protein [Siculibacillus lacustris]TBW39286.1 hypothetical protein EYW49_07300 [Siculibacillus lacustris]